jgi:O-methyltransferase
MRAVEYAATALYYFFLSLFFVVAGPGRRYGVGPLRRLRLTWRIFLAAAAPKAATLPTEQLYLVQRVLSIDPAMRGDVAEFGCFKGRTSAILSLACSWTGRKLVIFDSFEGLPDTQHTSDDAVNDTSFQYEAGQYRGAFEEVRERIRADGDLSVCTFVRGYFDQTLPAREGDRWALIFEDADLPSSVETILRDAWGSLEPGALLLSHEARDPAVVKLFFDEGWWQAHHGTPAPGFVGSYIGLPLAVGRTYGGGALSLFGSYLGLVQKSAAPVK